MHHVCGSVTQLREVSEPEKCEYMATVSTPAECSETTLQQLRAELKLYRRPEKDDVKDEL